MSQDASSPDRVHLWIEGIGDFEYESEGADKGIRFSLPLRAWERFVYLWLRNSDKVTG